MTKSWMIYGANGYSGELAARLAAANGDKPVLAGRNEAAIRRLADELDLDYCIASLDDHDALCDALAGISTVAHCAGPFTATCEPMVDACLQTATNYLDIAGEFATLDAVMRRGDQAREQNTTLLPGSGWDVIPSDCLLATLAKAVPNATSAELAIFTNTGVSRGTARTAAMFVGAPAQCRRGGIFTDVPDTELELDVKFPSRESQVAAISWGDIATAFYSIGTPDITTYAALTKPMQRAQSLAANLFKVPGARAVVQASTRLFAGRSGGPSTEQRARGRCELWARVANDEGVEATGTMVTPDGYTFTAEAVCRVAGKLASGKVEPGAFTPSQAFGASFVNSFSGIDTVVQR